MKHMSGMSASETNSIGPKRTRIPYWDNVKFILIFLVVLGHFLYSREDLRLVKLLTLGIYTFHMPAFAFVSGFLSKSWTRENLPKKLPELARLAIAYVVFNGIFILYAAYVGGEVNLIYPYYSFWYILALCVWRLTVGYVGSFALGLPLSILAALLVGFWGDAGNAFAFGRTIAFYPFFLAGYLMPRSWGENLSEIRSLGKVLLGVVLIALSGVAIVGSYALFRFDYGHVLMDPYGSMGDLVIRCAILGSALLATLAILVASPNVEIPFLTAIGKNSLTVYVLHRFFVLLFERFAAWRFSSTMLIAASLVGTVILLALLGNNWVHKLFTGFLDRGASLLTRAPSKGFLSFLSKAFCLLMCVAVALAPIYAMRKAAPSSDAEQQEVQYRRLSAEEQDALGNSYTILFAGDLVLLEDQVRRGYTGSGYDFSDVFEFTKPYIESADYAIGVLEGPTAGEEAGYSSGNFDDPKPMWMNFPDEFASAIADAGFDMVTTANNHLLDRGADGAHRTLDVLDAVGLEHVGSFRSEEEKAAESVKVVEIGDLKLAVLAYTYGVNDGDMADYPDSLFVDGEYNYITSTIVDPSSASFDACRAAVEADLAHAKELGCDLIVVLPHWGTQFSFDPDVLQTTWRDIFLEGGADIILGAHSHTVQPIVMEERDGRMTFTCYCPGNFTDVYTDQNVDAPALVEVRVSRMDKKVVGGAVIPMWTTSPLSGNYRPIPIYDILNNEAASALVSVHDLERVAEVQELETSVLLGQALDLSLSRQRYLISPEGFGFESVPQLMVSEKMGEGALRKALYDVSDVCFVGDGITSGAKNGGFGWYEPITSLIGGTITNVSEAGLTAKGLLDRADQLADQNADLYVIAVGANDVRYRDADTCAMTTETYVECLGKLVDEVRKSVPDAQFCFIAPWTSTAGDLETVLMVDEKREMNAAYAAALESFCSAGGHIYLNPNPTIEETIDTYPSSDYLVDVIHPNSTKGIELYARAVMEA